MLQKLILMRQQAFNFDEVESGAALRRVRKFCRRTEYSQPSRERTPSYIIRFLPTLCPRFCHACAHVFAHTFAHDSLSPLAQHSLEISMRTHRR